MKLVKIAEEKYGTQAVVDFRNNLGSSPQGRKLDEGVRAVGTYNKTIARDVTANLPSITLSGGIAKSSNPVNKLTGTTYKAGLDVKFDGTRLVQTLMTRQQDSYVAFSDRYERLATQQSINNFVGSASEVFTTPPPPTGLSKMISGIRPSYSSRESGGADLSVDKAQWDYGNWPFNPLFGLAYGMGISQDDAQSAAVSHFEASDVSHGDK